MIRLRALWASVLAVMLLAVGAIAYAATSATTATCTPNPVTTTGSGTVTFGVRCSVPIPVPSTVTQTVTVTGPPTSSTTTVPPTTTTTTTPSPGFPDASSTGPRVPVTAGSANLCGVVTSRLVTGDATVTCDATLTDVRITGVLSNRSGYTVTGSYVTIGPDACPARATSQQRLVQDPMTLDHAHLQGGFGQDSVLLVTGLTIRDSLIDRTCAWAGDHLDNGQLYNPGGKTVATLDHDTLDVRPINLANLGNSAVFLADTPGAGTLITVTNSLLKGGNYTLAAYDAYAGSGVRYDIRGNTFVKGTWQYGPCASNSAAWDGTTGLRFSGNTYDDGTAMPSC